MIIVPEIRFKKDRRMVTYHVLIPLFKIILKVFKGTLVCSTDSQCVINRVVNYCTSSTLQSQYRWKHTITIEWTIVLRWVFKSTLEACSPIGKHSKPRSYWQQIIGSERHQVQFETIRNNDIWPMERPLAIFDCRNFQYWVLSRAHIVYIIFEK